MKKRLLWPQNDGTKTGNLKTKRWQNRTCLEVLERYQNASALLSISVANVTLENSTNRGGYAFALLGLKI
ncbi:unnamed protein product [Rhizophagus irregularis]|nr:unnamed protein product [Rhizophagus irregularis]CAB4389815.1 unnamed protein product [Rhizophagus irregularis]CAB4391307.1 unnamed protein product [Rhizophagus irregularis]CAB5367127.1 unnamed protein product [Rhizophagus irregularis]CAB5371086.1 unnamed protein product [Rhizophagus irregularis]